MEKQNSPKGIKIKPMALLPKFVVVLIIIVLTISTLGNILPMVINKKAFEDAAAEIENYKGSATFDPDRGIVVVKENEDGTKTELEIEDVFDEIDGLENYLKDDEESTKEEKLQYLINAELVTQYPYISSLEGDESKLNGVVRFHRYTNQLEAEEGEEILEEEEDNEEEEEHKFNPKELFYIGDSWMVGLNSYIKNHVKDEYPGDNHFLCEKGLSSLAEKFSNENLKSAIDAVNSEVSSIVIMLGLNGTSEQAATRMNEIIDFLSSTYSDKVIYVLKVPHVGSEYYLEEYDVDAIDLNVGIDAYNPIVLEHCSEIANVKFIDATSNMMTDDLFLEPKYTADDALHLNNAGNAFWYNNIKECIEKGKSSADVEKFLMTYVDEEEFKKMADASRNSGNKEIFKYYTINEENEIVIAIWRETTRTVRTNDPEITTETLSTSTYTYSEVEDGVFTSGKFMISTTPVIKFDTLVQKYTMPFNLLFAFLVQTNDWKLTAEIADLAYNSKICVGIYDNEVVSVQNNSETYNKKIIYTENTELIFPAVGQTNPSFNILNSKYSGVIRYCYGAITEERKVRHYGNVAREEGWHEPEEPLPEMLDNKFRYDGTMPSLYVSDMSEDKIITGLIGQEETAKDFTTSTHVTTINCTTPSIGIFLVDNWLARWETTYKITAEDSTTGQGSGESDDDKYESIELSQIENSLLGTSSLIGNRLTTHSENIKKEAIKKIVDNTSYTVPVRQITKAIVRSHLNRCHDDRENIVKCQDRFETAFGKKVSDMNTIELNSAAAEILAVQRNYTGNDQKIIAKNKILSCIEQEEAQLRVEQRKQKKINFENELKTKITYKQWPTVQKANVNNTYSYANTKTPYSYETDETTVKNEGIKFKKIISKSKYFKAKQGILNRTDWFWDYISSAKDTAQLEDAIRVMFNIALETDQFGTFDEDELKRIFKAFEPQLRKKSGGGHLNAFAQWLMTFENGWMRNYINGNGTSYETVKNYVTEDGQFGKMYFTEFDGCWNFSYGIMVCNKEGGLNNEGLFAEYGYDLADMVARAKAGETVTVPMEDLDQMFMDLVRRRYNHVKSSIESHDVKMEVWQYYALVNFSYQWGNCGEGIEGEDNIAELYKKYYLEEQNPEKFRESAQCITGGGGRAHFWIDKYTLRQDCAWILFHEGRYILGTGEEIFPSGSSDYPEGIRIIQVGDYVFPQYPQTPGGGPQYVLYEDVPFGGPKSNGNEGQKTLRTSACGVFSAACIISGLSEDASIDPITYTENLDEYFPNGDYYSYGSGGTSEIWNKEFLKKYYGFTSGYGGVSIEKMKQVFEEKMGYCGAIMLEDGHYIAAIPIIDAYGKCESFQIIDSTGQHTGVFESAEDYVQQHPDAIFLSVCTIIY